jgi:hypothetical protein
MAPRGLILDVMALDSQSLDEMTCRATPDERPADDSRRRKVRAIQSTHLALEKGLEERLEQVRAEAGEKIAWLTVSGWETTEFPRQQPVLGVLAVCILGGKIQDKAWADGRRRCSTTGQTHRL